MEAGDRAASTRLFMSNGKCDAAGETDPALAHIPRALRDALAAAAAFQSTSNPSAYAAPWETPVAR
jgi:hypothetical protein